jgi:mitogen-activated protein kinase kinase kinase
LIQHSYSSRDFLPKGCLQIDDGEEMRRHNPTLYTHIESLDPQDDWIAMSRMPLGFSPTPHTSNPNVKSRVKLRQRTSASSSSSSTSSATTPAEAQQGNYYNIYNQFLRRYRAEPGDDDPRNDPDSHYFQRGLGQLVDAGDSDEDDIAHGPTGDLDRVSLLMLDSEPIEPETVEDRERLEWQIMLASVLSGDVLKSEKFRIATALETSGDGQSHLHSNIWLGLRAKLRGRSEEEERKSLEERRLRIVDLVINEILTFRVNTGAASEDPYSNALKQVNVALHHLDVAMSLYPCIKAFLAEKPAAQTNAFQARCDTLNSWSTLLTALRHELDLLRRWTGSETLDVTQAATEFDDALSNPNQRSGNNNPEATTFIDRLLKEENVQREFEKGSMTTIHALVGTARDTQVNLSHLFKQMNLPTFEKVLVPLVSFATDLAQSLLRVRLNYAQKLKDPEVLTIDQMSEDIKVKIGFACTLKRHYEAFLAPDPDGNWNLPPCISADYDRVILEALAFFFKLIHWKLKSGAKGIYFKETDVIEAQWATFNDVSLTVTGGSSAVAEQLWYVVFLSLTHSLTFTSVPSQTNSWSV